jgi:hypothetical protein
MGKRRKRWIRGLAIVAFVVIVITLRACFMRPATNFPGAHFNRGHNAAWLGVEWSMDPHNATEVAALAEDLQRRQIDTIFVYVSYLKPTGLFNPTYTHAHEFVAALKQAAPQIEIQAWLGIPVKAPPGSPLASGYIDLSDATVQQTIVDFSRSAVQELGFDGIHLDPEPIGSDDQALLKLLREIRSTLGENKHLSIAIPARLPVVGEVPLLSQLVWSTGYYTAVTSEVDAVAVMTYDSAMPAAFLYQSWLQLQVVSLTQALDGTRADVYIGIPASEETTGAHLPWAENMRAGLGGVVAGLNDSDSCSNVITGVAIYPYWEMSDDKWTTYQNLWLGKTEQ